MQTVLRSPTTGDNLFKTLSGTARVTPEYLTTDANNTYYNSKLKDVTLMYRDTDFLTNDNVRTLINLNSVLGTGYSTAQTFCTTKK